MSDEVEVICNNDGSIKITGNFKLKDGSGNEFGLGGRTTIGLCRCGHSNNKPFCDGGHKRAGFQDQVVARDLPPPVKK